MERRATRPHSVPFKQALIKPALKSCQCHTDLPHKRRIGHTHIHTHSQLRSLVVSPCPGEVTQEISRCSSHWKCVLSPPHWGGKEKGRGVKEWIEWEKRKEREGPNSWMRMAYLCRCDSWKTEWRCHGDPHPARVKDPVLSQVRWNVTFVRPEHKGRNSPSENGSVKRTSEVGDGEPREECLAFKALEIILILSACEAGEGDTLRIHPEHTPDSCLCKHRKKMMISNLGGGCLNLKQLLCIVRGKKKPELLSAMQTAASSHARIPVSRWDNPKHLWSAAVLQIHSVLAVRWVVQAAVLRWWHEWSAVSLSLSVCCPQRCSCVYSLFTLPVSTRARWGQDPLLSSPLLSSPLLSSPLLSSPLHRPCGLFPQATLTREVKGREDSRIWMKVRGRVHVSSSRGVSMGWRGGGGVWDTQWRHSEESPSHVRRHRPPVALNFPLPDNSSQSNTPPPPPPTHTHTHPLSCGFPVGNHQSAAITQQRLLLLSPPVGFLSLMSIIRGQTIVYVLHRLGQTQNG